jgi:hypothetical protein
MPWRFLRGLEMAMGLEGVERSCEGMYGGSPPLSSSELSPSFSDGSSWAASCISTSSAGTWCMISMSWTEVSEESGDDARGGVGGTRGGSCGVLPRAGDKEASLSPLARASMGFPPLRPPGGGRRVGDGRAPIAGPIGRRSQQISNCQETFFCRKKKHCDPAAGYGSPTR